MMPLGKRRRGAERLVAVGQTDYNPATHRISAETLNYDSGSDSDQSSAGAPEDRGQSEFAPIPLTEDGSRNRSSDVRKSPSTQTRRNRRTSRRRALTACQLCRSRKTKCDNKRPSCGSCSISGASCIYTEPVDNSSSTGPSINVSNEVLLEKLNHVVGLLERVQGSQGQSFAIQELPRRVASETSWDEPLLQQNSNKVSAFSDEGFGQLEVSEKAAKTSACESILRWPILQHLCGDESVTSFPLESAGRDEAGQAANEAGPAHRIERRPVLQEENIWPLCQKFLVLIHIKNPILEASSLRRYARQATEYGPGWDAPGCLVLLACALACLARPYDSSQAVPLSETRHSSTPENHVQPDQEDLTAGDVYFEAAKRRLGTLQHSLLSVQCHYFAGLYEKFAVRPLSAWMLLQQACVQAQTYLYAKALSQPLGINSDARLRHIEQRLYWSCVKAECELRADLQLPASGLLRFKYPDLFPFLSFPFASEAAAVSPEQGLWPEEFSPASQPQSDGNLRPEEERSWLYYLAEISLRKIMNRVLDGLYSRGEQYWLGDIDKVTAQHAAFSEELALWRTNLPPSLRFFDAEHPRNEFCFFLKTRYLNCLEWIHRPFLYYICHQPDDAHASHLVPLAQHCVNICTAIIPLISKHHRHGGIWGLMRRSFGCALLLVAANEKRALLGGDLPNSWRDMVRLSIETIDKWQSGTSDLHRMAQSLKDILDRGSIS